MDELGLVVLAAVAGWGVGWAMRPSIAAFETTVPPLVTEVATAALFALAAWRYDDWRLVPLLLLMAASVALSAVDFAQYRLPNDILFPATVAVVAVIFVGELVDGSSSRVVAAIVAAVVYTVFLGVMHVAFPAGLGFGDVKLAFMLGFVLGWVAETRLDGVRAVMLALLIGSALGVALGLGRNVVLRLGGRFLTDPLGDGDAEDWRQTTFPFGPPLMAGAIVIALFPSSILG